MTATDAAPSALQEIPLAQLHESPLNPRRIFDPARLEELRLSILEVGVLTPLTVRPSPNGKGVGFEIGAGHRRYRAAKLAGLAAVPAFVRVMDDRTFLELLIFENPDHDHLHPLEEAQGYRTLMEKAGYDIARLAERAGKSVKYIYDRIKLLQLTKPAQKLFLDGKFTAGHAILLARLSPQDQARAIDLDGVDSYRASGVFGVEHVRDDELGLDDKVPVKAVSVREFEEWIEDHVRLVPEKVDLPMLFPEVELALKAAAEVEEKVVKITYDYSLPDDARDPKERTFGPKSWKRADGKKGLGFSYDEGDKPSKICPHAVTGVVVIGPGRGQAFQVCVAKTKCRVHWPEAKKTTSAAGKTRESEEARWQAQERRQRAENARREIERARWAKAAPELREAVAAKVRTAGLGVLADLVLDALLEGGRAPKAPLIGRGKSADDFVRHAAYLVLENDLSDEWSAPQNFPPLAKRIGLNAQKIVDEAVPMKVEAAPKAKVR